MWYYEFTPEPPISVITRSCDNQSLLGLPPLSLHWGVIIRVVRIFTHHHYRSKVKKVALLHRGVIICEYLVSVLTLSCDIRVYANILSRSSHWGVVFRVYVSIPSLPSHWGVIIRVYVRLPYLPSNWGVIIRVYVRIPSLPSHWGVIFRADMSLSSLRSHWSMIFRVYLRMPSLPSHWGVIFRVCMNIPSLLHWGELFRSICEPPSLSSHVIVRRLMSLLDFPGGITIGLTLRCITRATHISLLCLHADVW